MKNNKYIVTGCAGFIASHLVEKLLDLGCEVVGLDNFSSGKLENMRKFKSNPNFSFFEVDISDWTEFSRIFPNFRDIEGVFHLAARARIQPSIKNPYATHKHNIDGIFNVLEMMRTCGVGKIVYSASSSSYGLKAELPCVETSPPDCLNPYALAKYVGEQYCKTWGKIYGINNVCLKYFNVFGERSPLDHEVYAPVVGLFFRQAIRNKRITVVGDGEQRRDFTHYSDVVRANILAMENAHREDVSGESFNVGSGENYSINSLAQMVKDSLVRASNTFRRVEIVYIPPRPAEARETLASYEKINRTLGWKPAVKLTGVLNSLRDHYLETISRI